MNNLITLGSAALLFVSTMTGWSADNRPNIVFIMADDHAWQAVSAYGESRHLIQTPNIDRLAHEGMRFDRCLVNNALCGPARASILTGTYSHINGFYNNYSCRFDGSQTTFPKLLQRAGYQTAMIGKWRLETDPTGFDHWEILPEQGVYYNPPLISGRSNGKPVKHPGYVTDIITDLSLDWLKQRETNKPFMLLCWQKAPHRNWKPALRDLDFDQDRIYPLPDSLFDDYSGRGLAEHDQKMTIADTMTLNSDCKLAEQPELNAEQKKFWNAYYAPRNAAFLKQNLTGRALTEWKYNRFMHDYLGCIKGVDDIYYRATKQRVRLPITPELVLWVEDRITAARRIAAGPIPPPLVASPKCPRCSLAPICLPDETRFLAATPPQPSTLNSPPGTVRRLIVARDDSRALYLSTPGLRVGRSEEVLQIKEEKTVLDEVRINDVSHVALFGNIQITTQAIQALCELEVPITYFSMGGWFYGVPRGHALKNVFLRIEQFRLAGDPATCLRLARQFVQGKIRSHRTLLMRNHLEPPPATLLQLKQCADAAARAESIASLLGTEGAAAAAYFQQFDGMIKTADDLDDQLPGLEVPAAPTFRFQFNGRNRRPPTDPVNALLSLAYSLLSKDCLLAALAVGFDPYLGFYHQPRFGRPALALDLMEEFRPLIAESAVLSCINNRVVSEADFVRAGQAVNLTAAGRKRFFHAYEQRMNSLLTHPIFDYKVS